MTSKAGTSEGTPSLVFFRSAEEESRIFDLLFDYLRRCTATGTRTLLSLELESLIRDDHESCVFLTDAESRT